MIVLIHTIWHAIAELSIPAWQKEVRNIPHEVVEAMKEAIKNGNDVCYAWNILPCHNKPEFAYGIFNYQKHLHPMFLCTSRRRLAKENRQAVVDSCSSWNQRHVQVLAFFLFLRFSQIQMQLVFLCALLHLFVSACAGFVLLILFFHGL